MQCEWESGGNDGEWGTRVLSKPDFITTSFLKGNFWELWKWCSESHFQDHRLGMKRFSVSEQEERVNYLPAKQHASKITWGKKITEKLGN